MLFLGWVSGFRCMEMNKKSGSGDVRAKALSWDGEWDKARKLIFSFISTLAHGGSLCAPLTSLAARKKSRFAKKKSASPKRNCAYGLLNCRVWRRRLVGIHPLVGAQYFAPASADGIPIVQESRAVGSEGRAQNIAPLHLMRCLIAGCRGL